MEGVGELHTHPELEIFKTTFAMIKTKHLSARSSEFQNDDRGAALSRKCFVAR